MVTQMKRDIAALAGMQNVDAIAEASVNTDIPFYAACALIEGESWGKNIFGHDAGGVYTAPGETLVTPERYHNFIIRVMNGETSNGVGPAQITYAGGLVNGHRDGGYFRQMAEQGLLPWDPQHNVEFGLGILKKNVVLLHGDWTLAAARYNGGPNPNVNAMRYGRSFWNRVVRWRAALDVS